MTCDVKSGEMQKKLENLRQAKQILLEKRNQKIKQMKANAKILNLKKKLKNESIGFFQQKHQEYIRSPQTSPIHTPISDVHWGNKDKYFSPIISDIIKNTFIRPSGRRYSRFTKLFAMGLLIISFSAFKFARNFIPLPSRQILTQSFHADLSFKTNILTDLSQITTITSEYRERENISKSEKIKAVLAVDAISFDKVLKIDSQGNVIGTTREEVVGNLDMENLEKKIASFENFVKQRKELLISDAFVFQVQPVLINYPSFVVHVLPSSQGKGTDREVNLLLRIHELLESEHFAIVSYAFDGDSCYSGLHNELFEKYEQIIKSNMSFLNFSNIKTKNVISDPFHLLKRGRYRLISCNVHSGFYAESPILNISQIKEVLNLPSIVFSPLGITKMHDDLATDLFSFHSLIILIHEQKNSYLAYFLPLCLMNVALSEKELVTIERINLLEIAFYFCFLLKQETQTECKLLPQKKSKNNNYVRLFDEKFISEITNTLFSILSILYSTNGMVNLNRLSSNPLEHTFGLIRMKSRYSHTFKKGIESLGKVQLMKKISNIVKKGNVLGRKSYYGQTIYNNLTSFKTVLNMDPRDLATCLHMHLNLPIRFSDIVCSDMNSLLILSKEISDTFFELIENIYTRCYPSDRQKIKLNTNALRKLRGNILNRFQNKQNFK